MAKNHNNKQNQEFRLPNGQSVRFAVRRRPALAVALRDEQFASEVHGDFEMLVLGSECLASEPEFRAIRVSTKDLKRLRDQYSVLAQERTGRGEVADLDAALGVLLDARLGRTSRERFASALDELVGRTLAAGDRSTAQCASASLLALLAGDGVCVPAIANRILRAVGALVGPPPPPLRQPTALPPRRLHRYAEQVRRRKAERRTLARHLAKGNRLFLNRLYRPALEEFQKAWLLASTPEEALGPLLETARCHSCLEHRGAALAALRLARAVASQLPKRSPRRTTTRPARRRLGNLLRETTAASHML